MGRRKSTARSGMNSRISWHSSVRVAGGFRHMARNGGGLAAISASRMSRVAIPFRFRSIAGLDDLSIPAQIAAAIFRARADCDARRLVFLAVECTTAARLIDGFACGSRGCWRDGLCPVLAKVGRHGGRPSRFSSKQATTNRSLRLLSLFVRATSPG